MKAKYRDAGKKEFPSGRQQKTVASRELRRSYYQRARDLTSGRTRRII